MTADRDRRVQTLWARAVVGALASAGVRAIVTSPGSRSTPLVVAAERAGLAGASLVDERVAAFYALGRARVTGEPAALLCTSGTAGAHYLPAIIEASEIGAPLVAITADRPPELHGAAAPQTIDQTHLYGRFVRHAVDLGAPEAGDLALRAAVRRTVQAVEASTSPRPGPVHINAPLRQPLEPAADDGEAAGARPAAAPRAHPGRLAATGEAIEHVASRCRRAGRGIIVAGPAAPGSQLREAAASLAEATGFPVLAEAASQLRFAGDAAPPGLVDGFDLALESARVRDRVRADLAIQLGRPPTSASLAGFLAEEPAPERIVLAGGAWPDPDSRAAVVVHGDVADTARRVAGALREDPGARDPRLSRALHRADAIAWRSVEADLARADGELHEGAAVRASVAAIPAGGVLALGNSLPIRTVDRYCPARLARAWVVSQRGANGIDGLIAGAAGAASAGDRPVVLVLGDVSFAHDVGGLAAASTSRAPLAIVVLDNGGGRIFDLLPIADAAGGADWYRRRFSTPPALSPERAAAAFGLRAFAAHTADELAARVRGAASTPGCTVIRAAVTPDSAARSLRRLRREVDRAAGEAAGAVPEEDRP